MQLNIVVKPLKYAVQFCALLNALQKIEKYLNMSREFNYFKILRELLSGGMLMFPK
jgi:hypothetical protein